ncbi:MAG: biopolymer transporter ExbD [Zoogloeaceae bacterium]|nr:biopolymer transporter ExbD [Zoogloeaceae bacterium]
MAFGGFERDARGAPMSEINMVPLIDVMLVLLIVFMITAPLLTHSVKIDLPIASSTSSNEKPDTVTLAIDASGALFWNNQAIDEAALAARLEEAAALSPQPELHLRADKDTRYERLAQLMAQVNGAGLQKLGFVTQPE